MECITIAFGKFFKAEGKDKREAIARLKQELRKFMEEHGIEGSYEIEVLCTEV